MMSKRGRGLWKIRQTWTRGGRGSKIPKFVQTYLMEAPLTITISSSNNKITITVVIAFHFSGITLLITKPQSHIFETARSTEQPALPPYVPRLPTSLRPSQAPKQSLMTITATSTPHIYRVSPYERDRIFSSSTSLRV